MSVNDVQNNQPRFLTMAEFDKLSKSQQKRWNKAGEAEREQMTIEFRQAAAAKAADGPIKGAEVEPAKEENLTPEEKLTRKERREAAKKAKEADFARMKAESEKYAASLYAPKELSEDEAALRDLALEATDTDKPLYKNRKAKKALVDIVKDYSLKAQKTIRDAALEKAETEEQKQAILKEFEELEKYAEKGAKVVTHNITLGTKIESTRLFGSKEELKDAKKKLGDEADDLRLKVINQKYIGEHNANLHNIMERDGVTVHEAAFEISEDISGDRRFEPNERDNFAAKSSDDEVRMRAAKKALKDLGYEVKDDTWKNLLKGLGVATLSALGASAVPTIVNAFAEAVVTNAVTGATLVSDSASAKATIFNWKGGAVGGIIGGAAATALFGGTEDEDVLHGVGVEEIFKDVETKDGTVRAYENMSFGSKDDTEKVKLVMRAIDELDLTDEEKTEFLAEAAGKNGQQILSKKELVIAYMKAAGKAETQEPEEQQAAMRVNVETHIPEIKVKNTDTPPVTEERPTTYEYQRKSGEYWYGIAENMYTTEDGKPIGGKAASAIARKIKDAHNIARSSANMPDVVKLDYEIEIDGKKYKLIDVSEPEKFKRTISTEASNAKVVENTRPTETETVVTQEGRYGYEATVDGELRVKKDFGTPNERDISKLDVQDSLRRAHPPTIHLTIEPEEKG